ncbi:MAG TPA: hypothetical protein VMT55_02905 [Candidatus Sulfotelmatobacter sp.]|nr:hypothetical protein [Candidatus Sulfotelmatobacter sp.]
MNFRLAVSILIVFLLLSGLHLFMFAQNMTVKFRLNEIKIKLAESQSQNRTLDANLARALTLAEVEKNAKGKLGMVYPAEILYIVGTREAVPKPN